MSEKLLSGLDVLVTRPAGQADALCAGIEALGGRALRLPLLEIEPITTVEWPDAADCLVYTSSNAVRSSFAIEDFRIPDDATVIAVGAATASALKQVGCADVQVPDVYSTEGLLELSALGAGNARHIAVVTGVGGRRSLIEALIERGHTVSVVEVYRRRMLPLNWAALDAALTPADVAVITSGEALQHFAAECQRLGRAEALDLQLVVPSDRVVQMAALSGFRKTPLLPAQMSDAAIMDVIRDWYSDANANGEHSEMSDNESRENETAADTESADAVVEAGPEQAPVESVAEPTAVSNAEPQPEAKSPEPPAAAPKSKAGIVALLFAILALLIGGAGAGGAYYLWMESQKTGQMTDREQASLASQLGAQATEVAEINATLQKLAAQQQEIAAALRAQAEAVTGLQSRVGTVEDSAARISDRVDGGRRTWQIAEIEHLLLVANDRVLLERDVAGALMALQAADERLGRLADPRYFEVRKAVAAEIAALKAVRLPDVQSAALTLSSLADRVPDLPMKYDVPREFDVDAPDLPRPGAPEWWQHLLKSLKVTLQSMFSIRREDERTSPMLPPQQEFFLLQNLALKVETARMALLQRDTVSFRNSASTARDWLVRHFNPQDAGVAAVAADLERLSTLDLEPSLPDVGNSLALLRQRAQAQVAE